MFKKLKALFGGRNQEPRFGILRDEQDGQNGRSLSANIEDGNIVIRGLDWGSEVERFWGQREYEWIWTIPATQIPKLLQALNRQDDPIAGLQEQFSNENASLLSDFLDVHDIQCDKWSRLGD